MVGGGSGGHRRGVFGFPWLELRVRVRHGRGGDGFAGSDRVAGLRLGSDPLGRRGRVWQWVVDVDAWLPALTDMLATCQGFIVDDDCGRAVGVVEDVVLEADSSGRARLLVVQGWGGQRIAVPVDQVMEVAPGRRRLMTACRLGHLPRVGRR
jgi:hypothetical protein